MEKIPASRKRLLLAVYLDFILFSAVIGLLDYFFIPEGTPFYAKFAVFLVIEALLMAKFQTFGKWCLGVYRFRDPSSQLEGQNVLFVRRDVKSQETFLTIFVGVLLLLDGLKGVVRWTEEFVPFPFFGFEMSLGLYITYEIVFGLLFVFAGIYVLKLTQKGWWLAVALLSFNLSLAVFQGETLTTYFKAKQEIRRQNRGQPPGDPRVEQMAKFIPIFVYAFYAIPLGILVVQRKKFTLREEKGILDV